MLKYIIAILFLFNSLFIFAQFSSDTKNPLVISDINSSKGNVKIATTNMGSSYIAWENFAENSPACTIEMQYIDINGNKKWAQKLIVTSLSSNTYFANDFNLVATSNGEAIISVVKDSETISVYKIKTDGNFAIQKDITLPASLADELTLGHSTILDNNNKIIIAAPLTSKTAICELSETGSDLEFTVRQQIAGYNMMPKLCLGQNNSFYVVYRVYNNLYADCYNANFDTIWNSALIASTNGMDLPSSNSHFIQSDGIGGLLVLWKKQNIYIQRIATEQTTGQRIEGVRKFGQTGLQLGPASMEGFAPMLSANPNSKTVNVAWHSKTSGSGTIRLNKLRIIDEVTNEDNIFVEKLFGNDGIVLLTDAENRNNFPVGIGSVTSNDKTTLLFNKYNAATKTYDFMYTRIETNGQNAFPSFVPLSTAATTCNSIASSGFISNQMVVAWNGHDATNKSSVFAQNVAFSGATGRDAYLTSIDEKANSFISNFNVYPNPASDFIQFNLKSTKPQNATIKITNITGTTCQTISTNLEQGDNNINLQNLTLLPGCYYVYVKLDAVEFFASSFVVQ